MSSPLAAGIPSWAAASGGITRGASFPGSPSTGDLYQRSDLDEQIFVYDGTRWVTTQKFAVAGMKQDYTGSSAFIDGAGFDESGLDVYLVDMSYAWAVNSGTHDASNYWELETWELDANGSGGAGTELASSGTSHAEAAGLNNYTGLNVAVDTVVDVSTDPAIALFLRKTGSAGTLRMTYKLTYRFIAT